MSQPTAVLAFWKRYDRKLYLRAAQLADELGYHSFWVPEAWGYEAFQLLAEIAVHTRRIQLGTGIVNVFSRSPGLIAMSAATLDEISEGRLILGLGTSAPRVIEGFHGRPYRKPLTQLKDVIRVVRTLLAGGRLSEAGAELNDYRPFTLAMEPTRRRIPIYVAALKRKSITTIGEMADGWIPTMWPWDRLDEPLSWIAEGAARAGRDPSEIAVAPYTTVIPIAGHAEQKAREIIAFYIGGMGEFYRHLVAGFGFQDEVERIVALYKDKATRARAADAVTPEMVRALTISGDPATCLERLRRCKEHGVDLPIMTLPPEAPWEMVEAFLRIMAPR